MWAGFTFSGCCSLHAVRAVKQVETLGSRGTCTLTTGRVALQTTLLTRVEETRVNNGSFVWTDDTFKHLKPHTNLIVYVDKNGSQQNVLTVICTMGYLYPLYALYPYLYPMVVVNSKSLIFLDLIIPIMIIIKSTFPKNERHFTTGIIKRDIFKT